MTVSTINVRDVIASASDAVFLGYAEHGSDDWHKLRERGVGGSDVSVITGLNKWQSAFTLWAKKTGRIEESFTGNEATEWGLRLEPVIIDKIADENPNIAILRDVGTWRHAERAWQIANPDAMFRHKETGEFGIVEIKTAQFEDDWKDAETGEPCVPAYYVAQVQWYLNVFGFRSAIVGVLFHGNRFKQFEILANRFEQDAYVEAVERFVNYVEADVQPDWDGSESTLETARKLHPLIEDDEVELGYLGEQYFAALKVLDEATAGVNELKARILDAMGSAKRGLVDNVWTFSRQSRGGGTPFLTVKKG